MIYNGIPWYLYTSTAILCIMTETISTKLTRQMVAKIDTLVKQGTYVSRSEVLREAVRRFIESEHGILKGKIGKEHITEEDKERALKAFVKERGWKL